MDRKTIFLVDDSPTNLATVLGALENYYSVLALNSGEKLLRTLERKMPDLILLDIEMPDMSGYHVIKTLKANAKYAQIPVIFLTAKCDTDSELEGLTLGAIDYITKPIPPPALLLKRIEVHLLVEEQKKKLLEQKEELINFNNNLLMMVEAKTKSVIELQHTVLKSMSELVECRDDVTGGHIERTTRYVRILLEAMIAYGLHIDTIASWNIPLVVRSSQLHDVGKISVSDAILCKPGRLTAEEFEKMKTHTVFGANVIDRMMAGAADQDFLVYARDFAETHHERWDGHGYPKGLAGEQIPLAGRLMAVADVYDALVSKRPYKDPFPHEEAVAIIKENKGTHFDPAIVELFEKVSDEFQRVLLDCA